MEREGEGEIEREREGLWDWEENHTENSTKALDSSIVQKAREILVTS